MIKSLWEMINYTGLIFRNHKGFERIEILFIYFKIRLKYMLLVRLLRVKIHKESFFKYQLKFYDYKAFVYLFEEIFISKEYFFRTKKIQPTIIDCGSNIGMSILYFAKYYPSAKIIAVEADPATFLILKENVEINRLKNIVLYNNAVFDKKTKIKFFYNKNDMGSLHMSAFKSRIKTQNFNFVNTLLLSELVTREVDFLKLDVEGMEEIVLNELYKKRKFSKVLQLVIEVHHHIGKTEDILFNILSILKHTKYDYQVSAMLKPPYEKDKFQDVMVFAYKK